MKTQTDKQYPNAQSWSVLDTPEDLAWLAETHGCDISNTALAILSGNEDSPYRVELYQQNNIDSPVRIYVSSEDSGEIDSLITCGY